MSGVVEGAGVEPDAVDCSSEAVALVGCQEAAAFEVVFPFFEGVDFAPFFCNAAMLYDLGEEGE